MPLEIRAPSSSLRYVLKKNHHLTPRNKDKIEERISFSHVS